MELLNPATSHADLVHAFGLRLGSAMVARGWRPIPSELMRQFNRVHPGDPITLYTTRSWLQGEYLPRPARLISLAQCLGVPPHQLMYGEFYRRHEVREGSPAWVLSEREHRIVQCLRRLSWSDQAEIERMAWQRLARASPSTQVFRAG
ncbi:MAG: XRE family transcriptional regulator [Alphaproteobacteria bacterium]|nr:XRE family transcriptional regulator [Alphaproteobacteria bacterium]